MDQGKGFVRLHGPVHVASSVTNCWHCHCQTPVHALVAADVEDFAPSGEPMRTEEPSFVYDISPDGLPHEVKAALSKLAPNFKPLFSKTVGQTSWANACAHCGMLQGAYYMHGEPDGPFFGGPSNFVGAKVVVSEHGFDVEGAAFSL